jgi:hypothetical protein
MDTKSVQDETYLGADEILAASDIDTMTIEVPEWKGRVCFLAMDGDEAIKFNQNFKDPEKKDEAIIRLFVLSAVNNPTDRQRIFTEASVRALRKKKFAVFLRVQKRLLEFNGFTDEAAKTAKND